MSFFLSPHKWDQIQEVNLETGRKTDSILITRLRLPLNGVRTLKAARTYQINRTAFLYYNYNKRFTWCMLFSSSAVSNGSTLFIISHRRFRNINVTIKWQWILFRKHRKLLQKNSSSNYLCGRQWSRLFKLISLIERLFMWFLPFPFPWSNETGVASSYLRAFDSTSWGPHFFVRPDVKFHASRIDIL